MRGLAQLFALQRAVRFDTSHNLEQPARVCFWLHLQAQAAGATLLRRFPGVSAARLMAMADTIPSQTAERRKSRNQPSGLLISGFCAGWPQKTDGTRGQIFLLPG